MKTYAVPGERVINTTHKLSELMKFIFLGKVDLPRKTIKYKWNKQDNFLAW